MRYHGDVIERLDRIEYLLTEVISMRDRKEMTDRWPEAKILLRVSEAAEQLGLSKGFLYQVIASGELPSVKIGRSRRIAVEEMLKWIQRVR